MTAVMLIQREFAWAFEMAFGLRLALATLSFKFVPAFSCRQRRRFPLSERSLKMGTQGPKPAVAPCARELDGLALSVISRHGQKPVLLPSLAFVDLREYAYCKEVDDE
jgi:hypothetical protein